MCLGTTLRGTQCRNCAPEYCAQHAHQRTLYRQFDPTEWPSIHTIRTLVRRFTDELLALEYLAMMLHRFCTEPVALYMCRVGWYSVIETFMLNIDIFDSTLGLLLPNLTTVLLLDSGDNPEYFEHFRRTCDRGYKTRCRDRYLTKLLGQTELDRDCVELIVSHM